MQIFGEILNDKDTYDIDVSYGKKIKINNSNRDFTSRNFYRDKSIYLLNNETHTQKNKKKILLFLLLFFKIFYLWLAKYQLIFMNFNVLEAIKLFG